VLALRYGGLDVAGLLALVGQGQGIGLLPARAVAHGVPLSAPPLVHRTELLAVDVAARPDQAPALVARVFAEAAALSG
jgi:DNA-binding transcriptional LysR family regulator